MEPSKANRLTRTIAKRRHTVGGEPGRTTSRRGSSSRATWITDPNALLAALERAEHAAEEQAHPVVEMHQLAEPEPLPAPIPLLEEPAPVAVLPALRDDERIGHQSGAGVVVIIRRRRAA